MNNADRRTKLAGAMESWLPGTPMERTALALLLLLALVLRAWKLPGIPYTHDELSALIRIYPGLGETIRTGVAALDTHPPGVQVFEWLWTRLFGMGEAAVKLPFVLMSVAALFFLYRFAYAWAGGQVALIITALLATMQYTVMYGQIARPYAAGLFTTALLADQLTRYLASGTRRSLAGVVLAAVLSAYTHHFTLMLAFIMCSTSLPLLGKEQRKPYLVACGVAVLLYLPNIPLLLGQLGQKGLDLWLAAPTAQWIPDYLWWLAHCSWLFGAVWILLAASSAALRIRHKGSNAPVWTITLAWGLLPLAVGYAYSVWRSPVLQYSTVLFSFPYILLGTFAGLRHLPKAWTWPIVTGICAVSVFTLVTDRAHYEIFYRSRYEAIARGILQAQQDPGRLAMTDAPDNVMAFYFNHWGARPDDVRYVNMRNKPAEWMDSVLQAPGLSSVFLGSTPSPDPERMAQVQAHFPFLAERHDMDEGQTWLFTGAPPAGLNDHRWKSQAASEAVKGEGWQVDENLPLWRDTLAAHPIAQWDLSGKEFGLLLEKPLYAITGNDNDVIEAIMHVTAAEGHGLKLITELRQGDESIFYRGQSYYGTGAATLVSAIALSDIPGHGHGANLRVYAWNEGGQAARISSMEVKVRKGNPWLYGFFQPLKGELEYP